MMSLYINDEAYEEPYLDQYKSEVPDGTLNGRFHTARCAKSMRKQFRRSHICHG